VIGDNFRPPHLREGEVLEVRAEKGKQIWVLRKGRRVDPVQKRPLGAGKIRCSASSWVVG
jgi:hypothetical protein